MSEQTTVAGESNAASPARRSDTTRSWQRR